MRATRPRLAAPLVAATLGVALAACVEPTAPEPPRVAPADDDAPDAPAVLDPTTDALREQVSQLRETVVAARDALRAAADDRADDPQRDAQAALVLLLDDPAAATAGTAPRPLFPAETMDREGPAEQEDALTSTLALAREAGGTFGRATVEALRDPIAGDLGAWERDAAGVVAAARAATQTGGSIAAAVDRLTEQVLELPGDGTRALAWTLAAVDARSAVDVAVAADRAASHLGVVLVALDLLLDAERSTDAGPAPTGPGSDEGLPSDAADDGEDDSDQVGSP